MMMRSGFRLEVSWRASSFWRLLTEQRRRCLEHARPSRACMLLMHALIV